MSDTILWYATRGAGVVTLILLSGVIVLGIVSSMRWQTPAWPRFLTTGFHRNLALTTLAFLALHIVTAVVDPFTALGWNAALIPFSSSYRRFWLGLGVVVFYVGAEHQAAEAAMRYALTERSADLRGRARLIQAPRGHVAGEESAAVHFVNAGDARPAITPPRPFERGVGGRPTLVQNVESLAAAALVARGDDAGTSLVTLSGAVRRAGVREIGLDATLAEVAASGGGLARAVQAVLLGGYFGGWV